VLGWVAGIFKIPPPGSEQARAARKHFGMLKESTPIWVVVLSDCDVPDETPEEVEELVPLCVPEFVEELVPL
jgi:hypothetical protein